MKVCSTQVSSQSNLDNKTSSIILTSERSLKPNLSRLQKTGTEQNPLALAMGSVREKYVSTINEENTSYTKTVHLGKKFGQKYGNVSGDLNPLHTSQMFAKVAGFKDPFVQGAFWVHFMLHQISKQHKIAHLNVYMVKPALLGQDFKLYIKDDLFEIKNEQNKVVCRGDFS